MAAFIIILSLIPLGFLLFLFLGASAKAGSYPAQDSSPAPNPRNPFLHFTQDNRDSISRSTLCSCITCMNTFPPSAIVNWESDEALDSNEIFFDSDLEFDIDRWDEAADATASSYEPSAALCPFCGSPTVICDHDIPNLTADSLARMHAALLGKS